MLYFFKIFLVLVVFGAVFLAVGGVLLFILCCCSLFVLLKLKSIVFLYGVLELVGSSKLPTN